MPLAAYTPRSLPESLSGLFTLALDLRWTWHHGSDELWRALDEDTWEATRNAWLVLNSVSDDRLQELAEDPAFQNSYEDQINAHHEFVHANTWYSDDCPGDLGQGIAYFCMEYGLCESLPLYSGGLGVLAGDYLKAASDLGIPVTAVGLLYQQGYFRQAISTDGEQLEFYPYNDPTMLPVSPLRDEDGQWVRVVVPFPGRPLRLRAWKAQVGRCQLLLLDSNDPRNEPGDRGITSELYTGDPEKRLQQEMVLGIGGWRLLRQLDIQPALCHLNEGHCALALIERAFSWQEQQHTDFQTARTAIRATNLFTTHTSVASGFDHFAESLLRLYLGPWLETRDLTVEELVKLGSSSPTPGTENSDQSLNMAFLALNMSGRVNGVSRIHQKVSQNILQPLFPRWPAEDIPAEFVTNGVHTPSWDSPESDALWTRACGKDRWRRPLQISCPMNDVSDEDLWQMRRLQRSRLVHYLRRRLASQHCEQSPGNNHASACGLLLDNETLTLGFARRFTEYKRPGLLLKDQQRLLGLLASRDRPLQIVLAGKAHPYDHRGKDMIRQWKAFSRRPDVEGKVVFIEDYDLGVASQLIQGVDVWLNCPRHPWEACGTSGMKVLVNGGLNLSQYDGWWAEAWNSDVGWAIRPGATFEELGSSGEHDLSDAGELFDLLEHEVIPAFYDVDNEGIPRQWLQRIRASMDQLTATYSANRMVREYVEGFYLPMMEQGKQRTPETAAAIVSEYREILRHWPRLRFSAINASESEGSQTYTVEVYLDGVDEQRVTVELVAEASTYGPGMVTEMAMKHPLAGSAHSYLYECRVPSRPDGHYTPRLRIRDERLNLPLENSAVLWLK
ncbi:glycosyltransferase family 1 protein [Marinobacter panjinensis]|uniref:Glycosyltransferase family 1 protein n=1 Tax=Marinobacter panjinensis TaxID=2576384 RepID=A0A4U6R0T7_9GAMM|nr:alpha-glucan family phosphorylase [Marinobacter panjinensis]MCR8916011.1 alpha-glucan family phosphorylase [Marinobacter panjinensis]TKV67023.1 glycosyltransferase family 1 protein [Marinobacter panjinensis]